MHWVYQILRGYEIRRVQESWDTNSAHWVEGKNECPETHEIEIVLYSGLYLPLLTRGKTRVGYDSACESAKAKAAVGLGVSVTVENYGHLNGYL